MVPPHQSLIPPSRTRHGRTEFENSHFLGQYSHLIARTRPSIADLDDETTLSPDHQSSSSDDHDRELERDEEGVVSCGACHKPLTLIGIESTTLCYICKKVPCTHICAPCSNGLMNLFDRRCSKLPKEIHYPYHPHPLTMGIRKNSNCCVCGQTCGAFNYGCDGCSFIVDIKCLLKEKKKYDGPITSVTKFMGLVYDL